MNAVISGQAGVALLIDGVELSSLHADRLEEMVSRQPAEIPHLLGEARDLQFLEGVEVAEVGRRLDLATTQMDALHLALILLDPTLAEDTRRTAAEEMEEVLEAPEVSGFVASVLYAHPIPQGGDLAGAELSCTARTGRVRRFLQNLTRLQLTIGEVRTGWEQIPSGTFGTEKDRAYALSVAVREGLFRDLVRLRKGHGSLAEFLRRGLASYFSRVDNHGEILRDWTSRLFQDGGPWARRKPTGRVVGNAQRQLGGWVREKREGAEAPIESVLGKRLSEALADLPPQTRRCVELRIYKDLNYHEIAESMGISLGTVEAHLVQAHQIWKEEFGDELLAKLLA